MNNKGFTVVELIVTFVIASVVAFLIFNIVLSIKNIYSKSIVRTNLLINQSNLSNELNSRSLNSNIIGIDYCDSSTHCYRITYSNGKNYDLVVDEKSISFGDYTYVLDASSTINTENIISCETDASIVGERLNSILKISIPVENKNFPSKNFGINFVYLYKDGSINFGSINCNLP